jgi:hypothetical protein
MAIIDQLNGSQLCIPNIQDNTGPIFESIEDKTTSDIQALVEGRNLIDSQGLLYGRDGGNSYATSFYAPPSEPPVSFPDDYIANGNVPSRFGGPYIAVGPSDGRY